MDPNVATANIQNIISNPVTSALYTLQKGHRASTERSDQISSNCNVNLNQKQMVCLENINVENA